MADVAPIPSARSRSRSKSRSSSSSRSSSVPRRRRRRSRSSDSRTPSPQIARGRGRYESGRSDREYRDRRDDHDDYEEDDVERVGYRVHIGDITKKTTREQLEDKFIKFGAIKDCFVANTFPQFAIVGFENKLDAEDAIKEMDGSYFNECKICVSMARPRARPRGIRKPPSSSTCYKCGRTGHFARECNRGSSDMKDEFGRDRRDRGGRDRSRDRDRDYGRDTRDYRSDYRRDDYPRRNEYNSNGRGRGGGGGPNRSLTCYRCGRPGHFARDCDKPLDNNRRRRSRSYSSSPNRRRRSFSRSVTPKRRRDD